MQLVRLVLLAPLIFLIAWNSASEPHPFGGAVDQIYLLFSAPTVVCSECQEQIVVSSGSVNILSNMLL